MLTVDQRSFPVTVRIEPPRGDVTPWRSVLTERLSAPKPNTSEEIRVLTPAGDYRDLPKGARVLNFAVEVHRSFVGWTKAAYVNGNGPFGLLHPLVNGDCVELVRSDRFQLPPEGWNQQIPRPGSVRSMLQRNFLPLVTETARAELRDRIQVPADGDDSERLFDTLLARAHEAVEMTGEGPRGKNIDWWQRQYGLYAMERKGVPLLLERKVDNATLERFCLALEDEAKSLAGHVAEIEIDPELRMRRARLVYCPECSPPHSASLVVTVESHALVLHDDRFDCGDGGRPVVRRRNSNRHHYFCIEARDRPDILVDVLLVFRRKGARVVGVVAERVGRGWAVIRVETGLMLRAPERDLVKTIKLLPDVSRVVGPGEAPIPMLENALPPRKWRHDVGNVPSPFVCGSIVKDPRQFYGREREMDQLRAAARAVEGHAQTGGLCLINGPLKIGKTSLAMNLQRELEQRDPAGTLWCYLRMSVEDRWLSCEAKIYERLRDRVDAHREQWPTDLTADVGSPEEPPGEALRRLVRACGRAKPSLVLIVVIDEFQRALASASHDSEQEHAFLGFLDFLLNTPHVLGVLVGPAASIGEMSPRIQQALRSAEEIRLGQLSRQESAALLKAEQMIGGPSIRLAKGAAPRAYKEVEGNPYWLNRLGKAMLDQAHRRGMNTKLVFDKTMLEEATDMLSIDDRLFVDQVEPVESGRSDPRPFRPLAQLLAKRLLEHGQAAAPAPAPALVEQLRSHGFGNFNADLVVRTLKTMRVMGGVIRTAEGYRMSSRLLARWVASRPRNDHDEIP
ncbi:MAG: AAA family ATPase [Nannocystaceae bacterium]